MALSVNRAATSAMGSALPAGGLWLIAGVSVVGLAACTFFFPPESSLAIATSLVVLLAGVANLRYGFLTFVLLYPFMPGAWGIDVAEWMPFLTARRLCCLTLLLLFLVQAQSAWNTPRVRFIAGLMLVLVLVQIAAGFGSRDPLGAVKRSFGEAVEWYFPFLIAAHLFRTQAQVRMLCLCAITAMAGAAVLAIIEHQIDHNFYDSFVVARDDVRQILERAGEAQRAGIWVRRCRVAFNHPIDLGLHLMCIILLAVYCLRQRKVAARVTLMAGLPIFLLALLYTYSRGPMLGLLCGVVWLSLIGRSTRALLPMVLLCGLGAYLLMPSGPREILDQTIATSTDLQTGNSIGGGTVRARISLLEAGLKYSQQNLWFGIGPGELRQQKVKSERGDEVDFTSIDNFYLQVLLRHGLITLLMTLILYGYLLTMFTQNAFQLADRDAASLAAVAAALCVANFVALVTVGINITLFWILLGPAARACDLCQPLGRGRLDARRRRQWETVRGRGGSLARPGTPESGGSARPEAPAPVRACRAHALAAGALAVLLVLGVSSPALAAPSFFGTSGLFVTPSARVAPRGAWSVGANYVARDFRPGAASYSGGTVAHSLTLTLLPRVEVAAILNNWEGKLGAQRLESGPSADFNLAGYNTDRSVALHWQAVSERGGRPAVALGVRDLFGTEQPLRSQYVVASWGLTPREGKRPLTLSAGIGTRHLGTVFGGVEYGLHPRATVVMEAMKGQVNGGFRLVPVKNFQLDAAFMGFRSLGGGLSYRRRF